MEGVLGSSLAEIGITSSDFAEICERSRNSTDISMEVVNQILAMDDFLTFKKLMVKRNLELELEAIKALREETMDDEGSVMTADMDKDMETHFMELSILYKQEEMEQAELESAITMSIAVQEEQLRLASVASKTAEDKFDDAPERKDPKAALLSPEEVHRQLRENKKKAEDIFKKNKESLEENKSKQKEWQQSVRVFFCCVYSAFSVRCLLSLFGADVWTMWHNRPSFPTTRSSAGKSISANNATASLRKRKRSARCS